MSNLALWIVLNYFFIMIVAVYAKKNVHLQKINNNGYEKDFYTNYNVADVCCNLYNIMQL
jgi:hypothetical protein